MKWVVLTMLLLPFATAVVTLWAGHRSEVATKFLAVSGSLATFGLACVVAFPQLGHADPLVVTYTRTDSISPAIGLAANVDQLSAVMVLLAASVSFLVQLYSVGYLHDDPRYPSYAALVSLFSGSMLTVVVADDLWMLLVGWELMGACSYFLIAHHWELAEARAGAVKAFLMTRLADLGLLFAILLIGERTGSYRISQVTTILSNWDTSLPALLIVIAVIGKSAQFPLHSWLPDAMPGPTPISALIHAATMVAAGVFLVARMYPIFDADALTLLGVVAAITMLVSAFYALVTNDLKRVLAWSTVSQLAYMFGALAVGAWSAAVLHLLAHGAFKALLFLGAGSVVHAVGGRTSMTAMGGLRERIPDTFVTMTVGFGALAGVIPLVGFFSKDAIVHAGFDEAKHHEILDQPVAWVIFGAMVLTAALTVAYSMRAWLRVFFGPVDPDVEVHESPLTMRVPLYLLTAATVFGGLVFADPSRILGERAEEDLFHGSTAILMTALVAAVAGLVVFLWVRYDGADPWPPPVEELQPPEDHIYDLVLVRPIGALARAVVINDRDVVDAYADGAGASARGLGWVLRLAQNGSVQAYLMVVVVGAAAIAVAAGVLS
ncbi:MAG TPA: NADH-quinone oxidoreductase subunit L [Nocardioidaceae bacterium]|nr:NADH-quinone oxidoreductase subunit L [Nocardioidaceae bacterium]